jgi:hypothetical protein
VEPAILMSPAPALKQDLPLHKARVSIIDQLERELKALPSKDGKLPLPTPMAS